MEAKPNISVVMAAFNAEKYLAEAIQSILNQTYTDFEFIIVNDGSTDDTEKIILSFNDKRIVYLKNSTNKGLIFSLNEGISKSKGQYIARMDADDISLPTRLQEQYNAFQSNTSAIVVSSNYFLLTDSKLQLIKSSYSNSQLKTLLLFATCFCHPTVMFKKQSNRSYYNSEFLHAEDYKLWTELAFEGEFVYLAKPLLKYRHHTNQVSVKHRLNQLEINNKIRSDYLSKANFDLNAEDINTLNKLGNNDFINSIELLNQIEKLLMKLVSQNRKLNFAPEKDLDAIVYKFWIDSCGYNNLGFSAFKVYKSSTLSKLMRTSLNVKIKLLLKIILRKYFK